MRNYIAFFCMICLLMSCSTNNEADLLLYNGTIYTVDSAFSTAEAVAVKDGKIIATGTKEALQKEFNAKQQVDLEGKFLYPGFIDAHAHFYRYGLGLRECDLVGTESWSEILQRLDVYAKSIPAGEWIIGRGWDQNDWQEKEFPLNDSLNTRFPDNPVILTRVDGHAAIVNNYALQKAGITAATKLVGGDVMLNNGKPTGVLIDNAIDLVGSIIPNANEAQAKEALLKAAGTGFRRDPCTILLPLALPIPVSQQFHLMLDDQQMQLTQHILMPQENPLLMTFCASDPDAEWLLVEGQTKTGSLPAS